MKAFRIWVLAVVAGSPPFGCLAINTALRLKEFRDTKPDRQLTYATRDSKDLTLGVFTPPGFAPATPRPALMIIHLTE